MHVSCTYREKYLWMRTIRDDVREWESDLQTLLTYSTQLDFIKIICLINVLCANGVGGGWRRVVARSSFCRRVNSWWWTTSYGFYTNSPASEWQLHCSTHNMYVCCMASSLCKSVWKLWKLIGWCERTTCVCTTLYVAEWESSAYHPPSHTRTHTYESAPVDLYCAWR